MAIDLGLFELAAPSGIGIDWILKECDRIGLYPQSRASVFDLFSLERTNKLRVSIVCHPCRWLSNVFSIINEGILLLNSDLAVFFILQDGNDFDTFVRNYLKQMPGQIGRTFDRYKCDARMKIEDMPWALVELLDSLAVPENMLNRIGDPGKLFVAERRWNDGLRREVIEAESELCLTYDYY